MNSITNVQIPYRECRRCEDDTSFLPMGLDNCLRCYFCAFI